MDCLLVSISSEYLERSDESSIFYRTKNLNFFEIQEILSVFFKLSQYERLAKFMLKAQLLELVLISFHLISS